MNAEGLLAILKDLGLSQLEAARLLGVRPRTINRWATGAQEVSGPAAQALLAWRRLAERGFSWRPDCVEIPFEALSMPDGARGGNQSTARSIDSVAAWSRPRLRWRISLNRRCASAGGLAVYFNRIADDCFVPTGYRRLDREADLERDRPLIEEAAAVFTRAAASEVARKAAADEARSRLSRATAPEPVAQRATLP
jgi:transcriptional regulator with XRE-family HTH domain